MSETNMTETKEVRENFVGGKLWIHIDDDPDHPLEKEAWMKGYPVKVRR